MSKIFSYFYKLEYSKYNTPLNIQKNILIEKNENLNLIEKVKKTL